MQEVERLRATSKAAASLSAIVLAERPTPESRESLHDDCYHYHYYYY